MEELQRTGVGGLDELIGGIPRGSRNLIVGPPGSGKTVFAMSFLWQGLLEQEAVSYDTIDRPWTHMRSYFRSFGWDIEPYEREGALIPVQAFPHFKEHPRDPHVRYFDLHAFDEMQRIDLELSDAGVTRFAAGDTLEHLFTTLSEPEWRLIEEWTIHWCHHDRITNLDLMSEVAVRDPVTTRMRDFSLATAHNIFRFRQEERDGRFRRQLRVVKMEGRSHPLDWLDFEITGTGIRLCDAG